METLRLPEEIVLDMGDREIILEAGDRIQVLNEAEPEVVLKDYYTVPNKGFSDMLYIEVKVPKPIKLYGGQFIGGEVLGGTVLPAGEYTLSTSKFLDDRGNILPFSNKKNYEGYREIAYDLYRLFQKNKSKFSKVDLDLWWDFFEDALNLPEY